MSLLQRIARTAYVFLLLELAIVAGAAGHGALAQSAASPHTPAPPPANAAPGNPAPTSPAEPQIDKAKIAERLNRDLGFDLESTTTRWPHALDGVDGELARQRLRYTELNRLRDELLRIRADVADSWSKIQPRLDAEREFLAEEGRSTP